jgi:hypothetical protein
MPYALCPMPYAQSYLIFLRKAIVPQRNKKLLRNPRISQGHYPYPHRGLGVFNRAAGWESAARSRTNLAFLRSKKGDIVNRHLPSKELKLVRGRDPYPRLPIIKGEFRLPGRAVH